MLSQVTLKFGASSERPALTFNPGPMTIFVGPNNSGKSLALRELGLSFSQAQPAVMHIVENIALKSFDDAAQLIDELRAHASHEDGDTLYFSVQKSRAGERNIQQISLEQIRRNFNRRPDWLKDVLGKVFVIELDGKTRLALTDSREAGDLQKPPANHLAALFKDRTTRSRMREICLDAFGRYFVVDPTHPGKLRIRMAPLPPADDDEEQALSERARLFHAGATRIEELSDGVKAFVGLLSAVVASISKVMLIDEPDAFLHPPLARKLGFHLAKLVQERGAKIICATHSAEFVMGCIESGVELQIVRLTYESGVATARMLQSDDLMTLMKDPLLRSSNVIASLFHEGVVVAESDADRAFYAEVNHRLVVAGRAGAKGTLFLNAQNKQTVSKIVGPLRKLGIPAAGVIDADIFKKNGGSWKQLLAAACIPDIQKTSLGTLRGTLREAFTKRGVDPKNGGINLLGNGERKACLSFFNQLSDYGVFVVPNGQLESWLEDLRILGHGPPWLTAMFERMRSREADSDYVRPSDGDVWEFLENIASWIHDSAREGIPNE